MKLSKITTLEQFDNNYWYAVDLKDFAKKIDIPYTMLNKFINGNRPVKADFALLLEKSLEIDADYWLNLQARYNLFRARTNQKLMEHVNRISKI